MTSILPPHMSLIATAAAAQTRLSEASFALAPITHRPPVIDLPVGPDIMPNPIGAAAKAIEAVFSIDNGMKIGTGMGAQGADIVAAFSAARTDALAGIHLLSAAGTTDISAAKQRFDTAAASLDVLAKQLRSEFAAPVEGNPAVIQLPDPSSPIQ